MPNIEVLAPTPIWSITKELNKFPETPVKKYRIMNLNVPIVDSNRIPKIN